MSRNTPGIDKMNPSGSWKPRDKNPKAFAPKKTAQELKPPAHLPQELIDLIISTYISFFDHDPAYQWVHLRHITRFHQGYIERRFLNFWIPNLKLTLYFDAEPILQFGARSVRKKSGIVRFKAHTGRPNETQDWEELVLYTTFIPRCEDSRNNNLILQLGEGILNKGYTSGGIISDIMLPNLTVDAKAGDICFDWKLLFTNLFREELVMRKLRDKIMERFLSAPTITKKDKRPAQMKLSMYRNKRILSHLQKYYRVARRRMLTEKFRDHLLYKEGPFNVSSFSSSFSYYDSMYFMESDQILESIAEESMVFHIPGWESLNIRDVAQMRAEEEINCHNHYRCELVIGHGQNRHLDFWEERWDAMSGKKRVSEKALEQYLKSTCPA